MLSVIATTTPKGGLGLDGARPWSLMEDLAQFGRVTMALPEESSKTNAVVMGRKTWESIPEKLRPLAGRVNVVLTGAAAGPAFASPYPEGVLVSTSVAAAVEALGKRGDVAGVFVMGGAAAYREALAMAQCARIFLTRLGREFECDTFFPAIDEQEFQAVQLSETRVQEDIPYDFVVYERVGADRRAAALLKEHAAAMHAAGEVGRFLHEECQYLDEIREIIEKGVSMDDRTGVGTRSMFGKMMRFSLRKSFPLLTTKRVFWRGVVEELLWFVKGDTNAKHLSEKGIKIWDANGSREFLDKRGLLHREEGDLGPVYGFQWRHFGAKYVDMHTDYAGQGVDQLAECIRKIKEDPADRRILLSAWNPADLSQMALPPCHMFCQFYVANGELSCLMYQRSCDMGLGVPFNIASYALLTVMVAQVCGLRPGELVHTLGNAHVYLNHIEPLKVQLGRTPRPFPVLKVKPDVSNIDDFKASDFELIGYSPHGKIHMDMAV